MKKIICPSEFLEIVGMQFFFTKRWIQRQVADSSNKTFLNTDFKPQIYHYLKCALQR